MGPVFESALTIFLPIALILALIAYALRKELVRLRIYLLNWNREDVIDDTLRAQAEEEIDQIVTNSTQSK